MPIPRRSHFIIEPLDHEKRGCSGAPPILERHTPAGREMGDEHRRPAFDLRQYFRIGRRRQPVRAEHGDAIAAVHLDYRSVAKVRAQWRYGAFERRAADFDVSVLLQSHSPASWLT